MRFLEIWINDDNNNMIEAKPVNIDYLLGREWELPCKCYTRRYFTKH